MSERFEVPEPSYEAECESSIARNIAIAVGHKGGAAALRAATTDKGRLAAARRGESAALSKAQERWGSGADTNILVEPRALQDGGGIIFACELIVWVNRGTAAEDWDIKGSGDSWEAAFADADQREGAR